MPIDDATWETALQSAHRQYETYVRQGRTATEAERRLALGDALQHAVGIIALRRAKADH